MTLRSVFACVVASFVVAGFMSDGLAGGSLPGPLASELTQYPGSKVLNANALPGNNFVANMNFGEASVHEVYTYYKAKMIKNGFTIQVEVGGTTIIGEKGQMNAVVDLDTKNGVTVGTLSLTGGSRTPASADAVSPSPTRVDSAQGGISLGMPGNQVNYPDLLRDIVKQYPGSVVMSSMENSHEINAMLTKPNCSVSDVATYYKKAISKSGWKNEGELKRPERLLMEYSKAGKQFVVNVSGVNDAVIITLALKN